MRRKNSNRKSGQKKAQTRIFKKGYAKATKKHKSNYGVGDLVLDAATGFGWSALRALGR